MNARYATQPVELSTQAEMLLGNASGFAAELNSEDPNRFSAVLTGKTDGALTIPFEARYDGQRYADLVTKITQLGKSKKVLSGKKLRLKVTFTNTGDVIVPRKGSKLSVDFLNIGYSAVLSVNRMSNIENCEVVESPQSIVCEIGELSPKRNSASVVLTVVPGKELSGETFFVVADGEKGELNAQNISLLSKRVSKKFRVKGNKIEEACSSENSTTRLVIENNTDTTLKLSREVRVKVPGDGFPVPPNSTKFAVSVVGEAPARKVTTLLIRSEFGRNTLLAEPFCGETSLVVQGGANVSREVLTESVLEVEPCIQEDSFEYVDADFIQGPLLCSAVQPGNGQEIVCPSSFVSRFSGETYTFVEKEVNGPDVLGVVSENCRYTSPNTSPSTTAGFLFQYALDDRYFVQNTKPYAGCTTLPQSSVYYSASRQMSVRVLASVTQVDQDNFGSSLLSQFENVAASCPP